MSITKEQKCGELTKENTEYFEKIKQLENEMASRISDAVRDLTKERDKLQEADNYCKKCTSEEIKEKDAEIKRLNNRMAEMLWCAKCQDNKIGDLCPSCQLRKLTEKVERLTRWEPYLLRNTIVSKMKAGMLLAKNGRYIEVKDILKAIKECGKA